MDSYMSFNTGFSLLIIFVIGVILYQIFRVNKKITRNSRKENIDAYQFNKAIKRKVLETYPHLNDDQANLVISGLRDYFHMCNFAGRKMIAMPSKVVDVAWHEFILFTKEYENFCEDAFGRFIHHTPAEAMKSPEDTQLSLKRAWRISCHMENISRKSPHALPLIFSIDDEFNIPDGFVYDLQNTEGVKGGSLYPGSFGCAAGCAGGISWISDSSGDSAGDSGCAGGCGGGGGCGGS